MALRTVSEKLSLPLTFLLVISAGCSSFGQQQGGEARNSKLEKPALEAHSETSADHTALDLIPDNMPGFETVDKGSLTEDEALATFRSTENGGVTVLVTVSNWKSAQQTKIEALENPVNIYPVEANYIKIKNHNVLTGFMTDSDLAFHASWPHDKYGMSIDVEHDDAKSTDKESLKTIGLKAVHLVLEHENSLEARHSGEDDADH